MIVVLSPGSSIPSCVDRLLFERLNDNRPTGAASRTNCLPDLDGLASIVSIAFCDIGRKRTELRAQDRLGGEKQCFCHGNYLTKG